MKAYVICCNRNIEAVVIGDKELAEIKVQELAEKGLAIEHSYGSRISKEYYLEKNHWYAFETNILE